jgi:hypothetical protein
MGEELLNEVLRVVDIINELNYDHFSSLLLGIFLLRNDK